jgi:uridine phosphorylase
MCGKGEVASYVLLPGDPGRVARIGECLDEYEEIACNREYKTITGSYKGIPVSVCSTGIGGPSIAIAIEELAKIGAKVLIRVGSCGALQAGIKVGDLIIPEGVVREEGTSKVYAPDCYPAVPNPKVYFALTKAAESLKKNLNFNYHTGITMSIDALYANESIKLKSFWSSKRVIAQEMEAATLLTLARLMGLKAGCIFLVVNELEPKKVKHGIRRYAVQAKIGKGKLVEAERKGILVALEAITLLEKR